MGLTWQTGLLLTDIGVGGEDSASQPLLDIGMLDDLHIQYPWCPGRGVVTFHSAVRVSLFALVVIFGRTPVWLGLEEANMTTERLPRIERWGIGGGTTVTVPIFVTW